MCNLKKNNGKNDLRIASLGFTWEVCDHIERALTGLPIKNIYVSSLYNISRNMYAHPIEDAPANDSTMELAQIDARYYLEWIKCLGEDQIDELVIVVLCNQDQETSPESIVFTNLEDAKSTADPTVNISNDLYLVIEIDDTTWIHIHRFDRELRGQ